MLEQIGISFIVCASNIDEMIVAGERASDYVSRLARAKGHSVLAEQHRQDGESLPILAADTCVELDGQILGKPTGRDDALAMLARLSGNDHVVWSSVCIWSKSQSVSTTVFAKVSFREISSDEAEKYWQSGEPIDKAGSYGIQGLGSVFIERIEGQPSTVAGLPLRETETLLRRCGIDTWRNRIPSLRSEND